MLVIPGINRFASCKTEVYVSSFFKIIPKPVSYNKFSIDTSFDTSVTIRAASFCIFISYCAQLPHNTSAYSSSGLMTYIYEYIT